MGPLRGGHNGSGPPSGAATLGAAAATYVAANASIRNQALTVRFIGVSPCTMNDLVTKVTCRAPELYRTQANFLQKIPYFLPLLGSRDSESGYLGAGEVRLRTFRPKIPINQSPAPLGPQLRRKTVGRPLWQPHAADSTFGHMGRQDLRLEQIGAGARAQLRSLSDARLLISLWRRPVA